MTDLSAIDDQRRALLTQLATAANHNRGVQIDEETVPLLLALAGGADRTHWRDVCCTKPARHTGPHRLIGRTGSDLIVWLDEDDPDPMRKYRLVPEPPPHERTSCPLVDGSCGTTHLPCSGCNGTRWSEDENWSPAFPESWKGERYPADGLIPCGFCNEGGWDVPDPEPTS